jgi:hypothetical protein
MFDEKFIKDVMQIRYGKKVTSSSPFYGNFLQIAENIKPKTNIFFGQIRLNHKLLLEKLPGFVDAFDNPYMLDLFTSLLGVPMEMLYTSYNPSTNSAIGASWTYGQEQLVYENILFDDIALFNQNSFTNNKPIGSLAQPSIASSPKSISTLVTAGNATYTNSFSTMGGAYVYAPEFISFIGYILNIGN